MKSHDKQLMLVISAIAAAFIIITITTSTQPVVEGCYDSPPARSLSKYFFYDYLDPEVLDGFLECPLAYNIVGLPVNITWWSYGWTHSYFLGTFYTDHNGLIYLNDIPRGWYVIEYMWNGDKFTEELEVGCCMRDWTYRNELDAKGGDSNNFLRWGQEFSNICPHLNFLPHFYLPK
jgi:hypothetical protein